MLFEDDQGSSKLDFGEHGLDTRPLAERMRPHTIEHYVGQAHLLSSGKPLASMIAQKSISSMILWGPPGTGKTSLARLLAENADVRWLGLSAVLAGVKDVREAVSRAELNKSQGAKTVLFVDEVHRFNKAQQDAFLPHVENGLLTFIGATTENPSFEVNAALLSRARVFVIKALSAEELNLVINRAKALLNVSVTKGAAQLLVEAADGDARRMLNLLETAVQMVANDEQAIDTQEIESAFGQKLRRFDKGGDRFYEQISALHKSVRGSAPDAALYWFCRMLDGGADPLYIGRRLIRMASEDVGNADPRALALTLSAVEAYERLGPPEGDLALAHAVLYLASVPKSDAVYNAYNQAMALVKETDSYDVPMHIRNAPTAMMKGMGYGAEYRHAHNEITSEGAYAAGETYFPEELGEKAFYLPLDQGLEAKIKARMARLRALDESAEYKDV